MTRSISTEQLRQVIRQQLLSLRQAGLREWRRGEGKLLLEDLNLVDPETAGPGDRTGAGVDRQARSADKKEGPPIQQNEVRGRTPPQGTPPAPDRNLADPYGSRLSRTAREQALKVLEPQVQACRACEELVANRTQTVFGVGEIEPRLVFLGEGPGADEDRQGEPFVGRAGQLLNKIIGAMGLARTDVYILNTVKCRPPGNRNPTELETSNCWTYLEQQLEILQPEIICCLGAVAARTLLQTSDSIARLRGRFHQYRGSKVRVTYHPSYLLRSGDDVIRGRTPKQMVWEDMKEILGELGLTVPKPAGS